MATQLGEKILLYIRALVAINCYNIFLSAHYAITMEDHLNVVVKYSL